jgi:pectin methylesterase-like acyl-CoA thioesterase
VLGATAGIVTWVTMLALASPGMQPTVGCATHVVTKVKVAYPHERTIQAAVNRAKPCDWIMVGPGIYPESVVIRTPNLHLRGLDRNRVVVDGRHRRSVNGIEVRASDVRVENLTVRNFDRATANSENGNQVWWHGAAAGTATT